MKDIYYAEKRIVDTLPTLVEKATNRELKRGLQAHLKETKGQIARLEEVFSLLDEEPKGTKCKGIEGILGEGDELIGNIADDKVLDAAIIAAAQAVEHYEITRYGALIAWAEEVDRRDIAKLLKATLKEEIATDKSLSSLAEGKVNPVAEGKSTANGEGADAKNPRTTQAGIAHWMDMLSVLRTVAAILTVIAACMVASNWSAKIMVTGFIVFVAASIAWIADGWLEAKPSLIIQNIILLNVNIFGIWRWLPRS